ncbi:hypothetical protein [Glycomyces tenuis]|nr:hypothetical protein [Glycomyces tenuis]
MLVLLGAGGGLLAAVGLGEQPSTVAFALFASVTPVVAGIDAFSHRLPFVFSGGALVLGLICFGVDALSSGTVQLQRAVLAFLVVGVLALAWWWGFGGQVGLGDVMLLAAIGLYTGWWSWAAVWAGVTLGFLLAAVAALVGRWRAGHSGGYLPLGPWLLGGCWGAVALAAAQIL